MGKMTDTIIHVPHSSTYIPDDVRAQILLDDRQIEHELRLVTDHFTDEMVDIEALDAIRIQYGYSRLVVDPERFRDDGQEIMASKGLGAVYTRTAAGEPLRNVGPGERERLLRRFYDPYHERFNTTVAEVLDQHNRCLIVDLHSFPSRPLPYELDQAPDRPDICIGTNEYHTLVWLVDLAVKYFTSKGLEVKLNRPFAGSFVPSDFYRKDRRVASIMVEVNRVLYMDEGTGDKSDGFPVVQDLLTGLISKAKAAV